MVLTKVCTQCGEEKPVNDYYKDPLCKACNVRLGYLETIQSMPDWLDKALRYQYAGGNYEETP